MRLDFQETVQGTGDHHWELGPRPNKSVTLDKMRMGENLQQLMDLLTRAASGEQVSELDIHKVKWSSDDKVISRISNHAWLDLRRYVDDADIRNRDKKYEESLRRGVVMRRDELKALLCGEDPRRRRATWLGWLLWRCGIDG